MFCSKCGKENSPDSNHCGGCGAFIGQAPNNTQQFERSQPQSLHKCPKCGGINVDVQLHQETTGSTTVTKGKSKYKQKGHGCLWWIFIGSWWWVIDMMLWICFFFPRLLIQIFKKKKYTGKTKSVARTKNDIHYKTRCLCKDCGNNWSL